MKKGTARSSHGSGAHGERPYVQLLGLALGHLLLMYAAMYAMVDSWQEAFHNLNMLYMALLMAAPMLVIMPMAMAAMYPDRRKSLLTYGLGVLLLGASLLLLRSQAAIGDRQFIRSMVPHHSGALLMCEKARLENGQLKDLCGRILKHQREEIEEMKRILAGL